MRRLLLANLALALLLSRGTSPITRCASRRRAAVAGREPSGAARRGGGLVSLALVAVGYRHAPPIAGALGLLTALGFVAVHLVPEWSMFSDPYGDRELDAVSWVEMLAALAGGLLLALQGLRLQPNEK